jgi:beta-ketodecanoyl-[acyl-carrier-protein] synthase
MTMNVAITGSGVFAPEDVVSNEDLCAAFNAWVRLENERRADAIAAGEAAPLQESSPEFIEKASGIRFRRVVDREGILDPSRMVPNIPERPDDELCIQAEYAVRAAKDALAQAGCQAEEIDLVILATSSLQRMYPAIAIEVQHALGAKGYAYDLSVGCSSATFPIQIATDALRSGSATKALLVNPEIMSGHAAWTDRDSHFIFGDAATALVLERTGDARPGAFEILGARCMSTYSTNIRNNFGYLNRCDPEHRDAPDKLFYQQGRRVFKDIVPLASSFILDHIRSLNIDPERLSRYWLHQANSNMNALIARRILGRAATQEEAPLVLDQYANTASAGSIIAFHHYRDDLPSGALGTICSFGAGYSIANVVVKRM